MGLALTALMLVGLGLVLLLAFLISVQKWFLYIPQAGFIPRTLPFTRQTANDAPEAGNWSQYRSPAKHGLAYNDLYLTTYDGVKLHSWFINSLSDPSNDPTIVFFHGNAGSIALRLPFFSQLVRSLKCNILAVEYRGFGFSAGSPSEAGLILDFQTALCFLFSDDSISKAAVPNHLKAMMKQMSVLKMKEQIRFDPTKIFVFGRSLGGAVSIAGVSSFPFFPIRGLIVENTFQSVPLLVDSFLNSFALNFLPKFFSFKTSFEIATLLSKHVAPWVVNLSWKSVNRIPLIKVPMLFLSSRRDGLVPPSHMDRLWEVFENSATGERHLVNSRFVSFPSGGHNNTYLQSGYKEALTNFVTDILEEEEFVI